MTKQYVTAVFEFEDGAVFPSKLTSAFASGGQFEDVQITAMSREDEITRVEKLEEQVEEQ